MTTPTGLFDDILTRLKQFGVSFNVTHYVRSTGARDATTGCYADAYDAGSTIEAALFSKAAQQTLLGFGMYVRLDALALTKTELHHGDYLVTADSKRFLVQTVRLHPLGDAVCFYEADLVYLQF